ncbi:flagellin [Methylocystis iwaonis]|uniref:Flagellin n=1 Tax=Methylocystis iwaonis TaxID=2885079 RepID=A0ABN6VB95_9HYPH|nr:flagellin [Methylocystis iwaonis]BDV32991.1 flagellin [Methylocystis iwaonis]
MSSILTNPSSLLALQMLRSTQMSLGDAQREISTGLKVSAASDNASTWAIATTMGSDQGVTSVLHDSLGESVSILAVASGAVTSAISVMDSIKDAVVQAQTPGADLDKIGSYLTQLGQQLSSIVASASLMGLNLLDGSTAAAGKVSFITSYKNNGGAAPSQTGTIDLSTTALVSAGAGLLESAQAIGAVTATDFTNLNATNIGSAVVADTLSNADLVIAKLADYASQIGAVQSRVSLQITFVQSLHDALKTGISSLVDADMNEVSTRLQALQTRQQLGVQSVSIANQNSQLIMKLFQ